MLGAGQNLTLLPILQAYFPIFRAIVCNCISIFPSHSDRPSNAAERTWEEDQDRSRLPSQQWLESKAREVFQTALKFFGDDEEQVEKAQVVYNVFAKMETRLKEYERARIIYKVCIFFLCHSKSHYPSP